MPADPGARPCAQSRMLASVLFSVVSVATAEVPDVSASRLFLRRSTLIWALQRASSAFASGSGPQRADRRRAAARLQRPTAAASPPHPRHQSRSRVRFSPAFFPLILRRSARALTSRVYHQPAAQAEPAHTYTHIKGALGKDNDAVPPQNLTLAAAEAKCSALPNCTGVTFASTSERPAGVVHAYFKKKDCGAPYGADGWQTYLRDYTPPPPPPPPSAFCPKYHPIRKSHAHPHPNSISRDGSDRLDRLRLQTRATSTIRQARCLTRAGPGTRGRTPAGGATGGQRIWCT